MLNGNIFTDAVDVGGNPIVDPDGDALSITHYSQPGIGLVSLTDGATYPVWGQANSTITLFANGDFTLDVSADKAVLFGPQIAFILIDYTDGKAADHSPDATPDATGVKIEFPFTGALPANGAPNAPENGVASVAGA